MKIALVLRGIPRYKPYDLGRQLLNKLLIEQCPDCDIKVITQIPTLIEDTETISKTSWKSVFAPKILNEDDCHQVITGYQPDYYLCSTFIEAFNAAEYYFTKKFDKIDNADKMHDVLAVFNNLCQHVNYLHSNQALINYATDNSWYPDLILNTRYDIIHFFNSPIFVKQWKHVLKSLNEEIIEQLPMQYEFGKEKIERYVFPMDIEYYKNKVWMTDWIFYEHWTRNFFETMQLSSVQQQANAMVDSDIFQEYTNNSAQTSHFYWHCIFQNHIIKSFPVDKALHRHELIKQHAPAEHKKLLLTNDPVAIINRLNKIKSQQLTKKIKHYQKPPEEKIMQIWNFYKIAAGELK